MKYQVRIEQLEEYQYFRTGNVGGMSQLTDRREHPFTGLI